MKIFKIVLSVLVLFSTNVLIAATSPTQHWSFDADSSDSGAGTSVVGILNGNAAAGDIDAIIGAGSLSLGGSGDWFDVTGTAMENGFSNYTVSLWFKPNSITGKQVLFEEGGRANGVAVRLNGSSLEARTKAGESISECIVPGVAAIGQWTFVAVAFNNGDLSLFVNEGSTADDFTGGTSYIVSNHNGASGIGKTNGYSVFNQNTEEIEFNGRMDDVRIYDGVALSGSEIEELYNLSNSAPSWISNPVIKSNAQEAVSYSGNLASDVSDPEGDSLSFSKSAGSAWLNVASSGALSGTPSSGDIGLNSFIVEVSDGNNPAVSVTLEITVDAAPNLSPSWNSNPITKSNAQEDIAYSGSLASDATDPEGDSLIFSKTSGPVWLSIASNGAISGTPSSGDVGSNSFTVSVSDGNNPAVVADLNIDVDAAPDPIVSWVELFSASLPEEQKDATADPDGDGLTNEHEYLFGLDPLSAGNSRNMQVSNNGAVVTISYTRQPSASYVVQTSTDLITWSTASVTVSSGPTGNADGSESLVITSDLPLTTGTKQFYRITANE